MDIYSIIHNVALSHPNLPAVVDADHQKIYTCADLDDAIFSVSLGLSHNGIKKGERVIVLLPNSIEYIILFFALIKIEAIVVPLKIGLGSAELDEIFKNAEPSTVVATNGFITDEHKKYLENKRIILTQRSTYPHAIFFEDLMNPRGTIMMRPSRPKETDIVSINYTYRGYGYPLGAMLTHKTYMHGAHVLADGLKPQEGQKLLLIIPMPHIFTLIGCIMVPLLHGMTIVILNSINVRRIAQIIREYSVHTIVAVPEVYQFICDHIDKTTAFESLKICVCGGSPLSPDQYQYISKTLNVEVLHGYGLTEFTPVTRNMFGASKPGSMGPACEGMNLRIIDDSGKDCVNSKPGELLIKSDALCTGYFKREKETQEAKKDDWFYTGDIVWKDDDGHFYFKTWKKKIVKVAGNMVDIEEVRKVLKQIPGVIDAACYLNKDNELAADVKTNKSLEKKAINKLLFSKLTSYKIPRSITISEVIGSTL